jgi:Flp pilus assembly protein TadG
MMLPVQTPLPQRRQRGAIAIMFAVMLIVMIGFIGLAIDLSRLYNRKVELQTLADTAALAAARQLNGTAAGIDAAVAAAATMAAQATVNYGDHGAWSPAAIRFGASAAGHAWSDAAVARNAAAAMSFVQVDTRQLDNELGAIETFFMRIVSSDLAGASTSAVAVAGRASLNVTPFAICAMNNQPGSYRTTPAGDLLQYGFRRGVGYDLMRLNPGGGAPENFVLNPIDAGAGPGTASNTTPAIVGPFVCAGTVPMGGLTGAQVRVARPFPLGALFQHLNSRFDQYAGGACNFRAAPPDVNIKSYVYNTSIGWMKSATPAQQSALSTNANPLRTIADLADDSGNTAPMYGPLWTYAKPVPFGAYTPGVPEPKSGYAPFATSAWAALYGPGKPEPKSTYPAATPYGASGGANFAAPSVLHGLGMPNRRVLNVPLLDCPVAAGADAQANVLAIGKFFMTVPATATSVHAEFAGIATDQTLNGAVELQQ